MKENKKTDELVVQSIGSDFFELFWEKSWTYIKNVVDVMREPVLILNKNFQIMAANETFYQTFQVKPKETEGNLLYELGNGQWNIPSLRNLLEDILPLHTFFKGFEVAHEFPTIGKKIMILNARQIHFRGEKASEVFPPIILLAMEDITEMMGVAEMLAQHTNEFELKMATQTEKMGTYIKRLEEEIAEIKKNLKG